MRRVVIVVLAFCVFAVCAPFLPYFAADYFYGRSFKGDSVSEINDRLWLMRKKQVRVSDMPYPWNQEHVDEDDVLWRYSILGEQFVIAYEGETGRVDKRFAVYE